MKKRLVIVGLLWALPAQAETFSKTFFSVIPQFQAGSPEKETLFRDVFTNNTGRGCIFEVVGFGGKSRNSDDLARYFLPFGKSEILVTEANATNVADRDVDAVHLNINHLNRDFQSKVKFDFHQTFAGIGLAVRSQFTDDPTGWWLGASTPLMFVTNHAELCETIENPGDTVEATRVGTVTDAFKQSIWNFGRIENCDHKKTGFADVELQLGYKWGEADEGHADIYVGVVIPTGNKPHGKWVFEPIVGNNQHFGILFGGTITKDLYATSKQTLTFLLSTNGRYLFRNTQHRSFDLKDKHWGRYMEVYATLDAAQAAFNAASVADGNHGSPGINVFTQEMRVTPGFSNQLNAALVYKESWITGELGYNLIARQAEKTCLKCWNESAALVSVNQDGSTTKFRTINHAAVGDEGVGAVAQTYKPLTRCDLDISSAAHPAAVGHELYASFGVRLGDSPNIVPLLSVGGSWEFASGNTYLDRWAVWAKVGVMF
jgi:hypothetical protein